MDGSVAEAGTSRAEADSNRVQAFFLHCLLPALQKGGFDKKLVGYFQADTGTINQLVHLWKFDDDADRRAHWAALFANTAFMEGFAAKFRPLVQTQGVKLPLAAPWGPHP